MKRRVLVCSGLLAVLTMCAARANEQLRVPQDIQPPVYLSGGGPAGILPDGSRFVVHDGEIAAITFWRPPSCVPADFNLLENFDLGALQCPLLIEGSVRFKDGGILSWEARGTGAVPIWFVRLDELEAAMDDGELTIGELSSLPSLVIGTADFYHEQNHSFNTHEVSHLTVVASGTLEDGGFFELKAIEVGLELQYVQIDLD